MVNTILPKKITEFLKTALKEDLDNFSISFHGANKGDGFVSEMVFITLKNKKNNKEKHYALKQIIQSNGPNAALLKLSFKHEIHFYKHVWKALQDFEKKIPSLKSFEKIPRCYLTDSAEGSEKLLFENLIFSGFEKHDKSKPLDKRFVELILDAYGIFHGISFAFREQHPQDYAKLVETLDNPFEILINMGLMGGVSLVFQTYLGSRGNLDENLQEICRRYGKKAIQIFVDTIKYTGNNEVISHGDSWSNNVLLKYNEARVPIDIRLLDFQLMISASPVYDLSYFIYSSTSTKFFNNLEYYLITYHDSLSRTLQEFGCDPEKTYSFQELKREWKQYSKFGLLMTVLVWTLMLTKEEDIKTLDELLIDTGDVDGRTLLQKTSIKNLENPEYVKRFERLLHHAAENGYL